MASKNPSLMLASYHNVFTMMTSETKIQQVVKELAVAGALAQHPIPQSSQDPEFRFPQTRELCALRTLRHELSQAKVKCRKNGGILDDEDSKLLAQTLKATRQTLQDTHNSTNMKDEAWLPEQMTELTITAEDDNMDDLVDPDTKAPFSKEQEYVESYAKIKATK